MIGLHVNRKEISLLSLYHTSKYTNSTTMGCGPNQFDPSPYMKLETQKEGTIISSLTLEYISIGIAVQTYP